MSGARVYVGTYAKYNNGSIAGAWIDLDGLDKDSFYEACKELHKDESDPELMFQDYEGFPSEYYGESGLNDKLWDWLELDAEDQELLAVYVEHVNQNGGIEEARDNFVGRGYDNESDWAYQFLDDTGQLSELPDWAQNYFDFESYARDARIGGDVVFVRHDGELWVFYNR